jgi:hypothetical protein
MLCILPPATVAPHGGSSGSEHGRPPAVPVAPLSCSGSEHPTKKRPDPGTSLSSPSKKSRSGDQSVDAPVD